MITRHAEARWSGTLKEGTGNIRLGSGAFEGKYSFTTRFEGAGGTNPEELLGAAHAGCYSMALNAKLSAADFPPKSISTKVEVHMDKVGGGMVITGVTITTVGDVPGISAEKFLGFAEDAKANCIISKAISVPMTLKASLA